MDINKIKTVIATRGYSLDQWTFLDKFSQIVFITDNTLILGKTNTQVYIDSNGLIFVRYYDSSRAIPCDIGDIEKPGSIKIIINDKYYMVPLVPGYINTPIGYVSSVVSTEYIFGFVDEYIKPDTYK